MSACAKSAFSKTVSLLFILILTGIGSFAQDTTLNKNPAKVDVKHTEATAPYGIAELLSNMAGRWGLNKQNPSNPILSKLRITDSIRPRLSDSLFVFVGSSPSLYIQLNKKRAWLVAGVNVLGYGGSLALLASTWYQNDDRTSFHLFNDSKEWNQVDKIGHGWAAYNAGRVTAGMWRWAGLTQEKAAWVGGLTSFVYLTGVEFLDAHSTKWGWSWSDMGANVIGSGLFIGQEFLWREQRIQYKFSFHGNTYKDPQLENRADDLFGKTWYERMLKDYNAQTYWFSFNLKSFFRKSNIPEWLNAAVGYGADGMFGGFENIWMDELGNDIVRNDITRKRQFYLSPDIDFTKINTKSKFLKTAFFVLNSFKFPAPALMIDSKGKAKGYLIYF